ncbi:unnamed protein product [Bursaphelenchus okinawaensis]|uniref:RNA methyltransferase n=1 Tax=Bursaphelenchus okinawaensis TaxID=465554 RepID=A0A811LJB0_9BILA|nr:unnamed protein product [Bursaphelenchus okinawaensis]CAG9127176.1 unnamed protein product [Bursaphelenchus okinawaensis]
MDHMEVDQKTKSPLPGASADGDSNFGSSGEANLPKGKAKEEEKFRYGNYNQYYGSRLEAKFTKDPRIDLLREEWFRNKFVLDVGCNTGVLTNYLAKHWGPSRMDGLDIDPVLVGIARKNIRHYCDKKEHDALVGKLPAMKEHKEGEKKVFPHNIWFTCTSYVFPDDEFLDMVRPEYDTIMALSITKWIHLNWGDEGLKRFFKRAFKNLKSGGVFIMEPQDYRTYYKSCKKIPSLKETYKNLKMRPEMFAHYLFEEVGFSEFVDLGIPEAKTKGYQRPIYAFKKK